MEYQKDFHGTMGLPSPLEADIFKLMQSTQAPLGQTPCPEKNKEYFLNKQR
jgi:hypothetical protein